jgi:hypothetical protein
MKENKFKVYKWKLIHYILPGKELLFKWHITTNNLCNNCQITENCEHFFFECKRLETFWRIIKKPVFKTYIRWTYSNLEKFNYRVQNKRRIWWYKLFTHNSPYKKAFMFQIKGEKYVI